MLPSNVASIPPEQKARKVSFVTDFLHLVLSFPQNTHRPEDVHTSSPQSINAVNEESDSDA